MADLLGCVQGKPRTGRKTSFMRRKTRASLSFVPVLKPVGDQSEPPTSVHDHEDDGAGHDTQHSQRCSVLLIDAGADGTVRCGKSLVCARFCRVQMQRRFVYAGGQELR